MITTNMRGFGQPVTESNRLPFHRPRSADPNAGVMRHWWKGQYKTHLNPFWRVMPPIMAHMAHLPRFQEGIAPGNLGPGSAPPGTIAQQQPTAIPGPACPCPPAGTMAGRFGGGNGGGPSSGGLHPYRTGKVGYLPGVRSSGANVRQGYLRVPDFIKRMHASNFPNVAVSAGGYNDPSI